MGAINDIFTTFGPEYLDRYGDGMPDNHKKAIRDIVSCRTETQGLAVYQCLECNTLHQTYSIYSIMSRNFTYNSLRLAWFWPDTMKKV